MRYHGEAMPPGLHLPDLELSLGWVVATSLLSLAGMALFVYGKRSKNLMHLLAGLVLMIYPLFISNIAVMVGIGVAIGGFVWWIST